MGVDQPVRTYGFMGPRDLYINPHFFREFQISDIMIDDNRHHINHTDLTSDWMALIRGLRRIPRDSQ